MAVDGIQSVDIIIDPVKIVTPDNKEIILYKPKIKMTFETNHKGLLFLEKLKVLLNDDSFFLSNPISGKIIVDDIPYPITASLTEMTCFIEYAQHANVIEEDFGSVRIFFHNHGLSVERFMPPGLKINIEPLIFSDINRQQPAPTPSQSIFDFSSIGGDCRLQ